VDCTTRRRQLSVRTSGAHLAARPGIKNGDAVLVETPRGAAAATALLWEGIREDTIFVPSTFGPAQKMGAEFGLPLYDSVNHLTDDRYFDNLSGL
jgi:formate dehydrogenase (coenzyme F420) alpha subunit